MDGGAWRATVHRLQRVGHGWATSLHFTSLHFTSLHFMEFSAFLSMGRLPWWLSNKEAACQCRRHRFDPWVRKILWTRKQQSTLVFLPGKSHGQRNLIGYSPWGSQRVGHDWATSLHFTSLHFTSHIGRRVSCSRDAENIFKASVPRRKQYMCVYALRLTPVTLRGMKGILNENWVAVYLAGYGVCQLY